MQMMNYIRSEIPQQHPQLLHISAHGEEYHFSVMHAGVERHLWLSPRKGGGRREHTHDVYHVVLYTHGESTFLLNGQSHPARAGTLVLAGPGEPHDFYPYSPGEIGYIEVCFALEGTQRNLTLPFHALLGQYAGMSLLPRHFPITLPGWQVEAITDLLTRLLVRLAEQPLSALGVGRCVVELLAFLTDEIFLATQTMHRENDTLCLVRKEIERRYCERLLVEELAELANLSPNYFSRLFKRAFGISPIAYQRKLRIQAAQNLLLTTGLSAKEIARRIGFEDVYFFSKTFKQLVGASPVAYRRQVRG